MTKKKKPPSVKALRNKADRLWSLVVRQRWGQRCAICGREDNLHAHHLLSRERSATRYEPMNGIALCVSHHLFDTTISAHEASLAFAEWLIFNRPHEWQWRKAHKHDTVERVNATWYKAQIARLEGLLDGQ